MLKMNFQVITSPAGEEMVVISKKEFDDAMARIEEALEDADDEAIYDARKAELAEESKLPAAVSMSILGGDSPLRALRKYKGLSQINLSERAGVTQGYLSDLESGRRKLTEASIESLSAALDVPAAWLRG